jgi:phosphatidylserine decarboxylase
MCAGGLAGCRPIRTIWRRGWPVIANGRRTAARTPRCIPLLVRFHELIESDAGVRMYLERMILEVPPTKQYRKRHLNSVEQMLRLINEVLSMAPEFGDSMVTTPLGAILDWTMGTPSGFAAFRDPRITAMLKDILGAWSEFLCSRDSLYVLNDSPTGWKCAAAREAIGIEQYQHDPKNEHWGFASWNDFSPGASATGSVPWRPGR